MASHYLIDGYNLIKRIPNFSSRRLQDSRQKLLLTLRKAKELCLKKKKITVVFDGRADLSFAQSQDKDIEVIFTQNESADEKIKKLIKKSTHPQDIVVISDDREICLFAWHQRSKNLSVREFSKILFQKAKTNDLDKINLASRQAQLITRELYQIWVEKRKAK